VHLDQEAVLTGDPVAFADPLQPPGQVGHLRQLAGCRPDPGERGDGEAEGGRVDLQPVPGDHPGPFETLNAVGHGRGRHADPAAERGHGDTRIGVQFAQQAHVGLVQQLCLLGEGGRRQLPLLCRQFVFTPFR
jgi:hypothetical protein